MTVVSLNGMFGRSEKIHTQQHYYHSLDGQIDVLVCGGSLEVQAGEQLQRLRIVGRGRGVGNNGELGMMELHLPGNLSAEAQILAAQACK